ncbi:hypothetical protein HZA71_01845 [Candidatus Falkowbacteria bacterium]|nr:hypothetical protein [Candidatus Falkowbacteria bacterium]
MYANQQRLIALLQKYNVPVILGTIIRHLDKTFHEKGLDGTFLIALASARTSSPWAEPNAPILGIYFTYGAISNIFLTNSLRA